MIMLVGIGARHLPKAKPKNFSSRCNAIHEFLGVRKPILKPDNPYLLRKLAKICQQLAKYVLWTPRQRYALWGMGELCIIPANQTGGHQKVMHYGRLCTTIGMSYDRVDCIPTDTGENDLLMID